jgi:hypothetical protein
LKEYFGITAGAWLLAIGFNLDSLLVDPKKQIVNVRGQSTCVQYSSLPRSQGAFSQFLSCGKSLAQ